METANGQALAISPPNLPPPPAPRNVAPRGRFRAAAGTEKRHAETRRIAEERRKDGKKECPLSSSFLGVLRVSA